MKHTTPTLLRAAGGCAALVLTMVAGLSQASATTYTVSNLRDSGSGSLRDAITKANANAGADNIKFTVGLCGTLQLNSTLPQINGDVNIHGPGAQRITITGDTLVFDVNFGIVEISDLTVSSGRCDPQGAIHNRLANLTIDDAIVTSNANGSGSGITNDAGGTLVVQDTAIVRNTTANGMGGGISNAGSLTLVNSTVANNSAALGGGIYNAPTGSIALINSTVVDNTAKTSGGGILNDTNASASLANTIVARNTVGTSASDVVTRFTNSSGATATGGPILSKGNNLIGSTTGSTGYVASDKTNITTAHLGLGHLANKGGETLVIEVLFGSPAINAGNNANAVDANGTPLEFDQRGAPYDRTAGTVDIGAYEFNAITPPQNAHQFKELALTTISNCGTTGNALLDYYLGQASDRISRSLDPSLWVDGDHLSPCAIQVFEREKQAVWYLQQIYGYGFSDCEDAAGSAISFLMSADQRLAQNGLDQACTWGDNSRAVQFFNAGVTAEGAYDYNSAISDFEWSYIYSQLFMKKDCRQSDDDDNDRRYDRYNGGH